jgi:hypothetical protein
MLATLALCVRPEGRRSWRLRPTWLVVTAQSIPEEESAAEAPSNG